MFFKEVGFIERLMIAPRNQIFRDKALKHYMQSREKDVLPNFSSVPVAIFGWLLLGLLIATGLVAEYGQIPVSVAGSGIILGLGNPAQAGSDGTIALAFFPPSAAARLHAGQAALLQISANGVQLTSVIAQVEPGMSSPIAALEHYGQKVSSSAQGNQPTVVVLFKLGPRFPASDYAGSALAVQVNAGTQSLFSAITGIEI
jgi:hypothetical protein